MDPIPSHIYSNISQVSNLSIRFIWLIYICTGEASVELRTFIAAMLEMLRRVQWNFCMSFLTFLRSHDLGI